MATIRAHSASVASLSLHRTYVGFLHAVRCLSCVVNVNLRRFSTTAGVPEQCCAGRKSEKDAEQMRVRRLLQRYRMLRPEDCLQLCEEHAKAGRSLMMDWRAFRAEGMDDRLQSWEADKRKREEHLERMLRLRDIHRPAHLRRRKQKVKRVQQSEEQTPAIVTANFTEEAQTVSLIEDVYKAEVYQEVCAKLDEHRPTLVNEFTDFDNPYMLKREAIKRLLEERGTRNALDESMIDEYLDRRPDLVKLRLRAKLPPEVIEPLAAFHGLTNYNFDKRTRLQQKVNAMFRAVDAAHCDCWSHAELDVLLGSLEENQRSDMKHELHPFRNHFGFVSAVPTGTVGSIKMGQEQCGTDKELRMIRYPTLQRVAHTLPKDPKYRAIVAHAIRVLERSPGWDFKDKVKAINTLVEVYNHLPPSATYARKLDEAFPVFSFQGFALDDFRHHPAVLWDKGVQRAGEIS
ncbi:Chromosome III, complete sequence, related [Eimeria maxima]|uniref:Chromosome III, complete sequence, related n=1 Tax=Eimeria maxima TaxID=5804 RepID=U6M6I1_EIMMA|nr:Chromosome III, complete sequence, related [Eimeria maxima]CDJ58673.1 Chromosome III, complete sequence, related [Eimeria maxima]